MSTPHNGVINDHCVYSEDETRAILGSKGPVARSTLNRWIAKGLRYCKCAGRRWFSGYHIRLWMESYGETWDDENDLGASRK